MRNTAHLLIRCADRPGIVAAVAGFMHNHGANILALDQHSTDPEGGTLFMRVAFTTPNIDLAKPALASAFGDVVAARFGMIWSLRYVDEPRKMVILASKTDHALLELLWRWRRGRLAAGISAVISNHDTLRSSVESFGVPFVHGPNDAATRAAAEAEMMEHLEQADVIVLARYMQILSGDLVSRFEGRIINIHHSFLPAFVGADPYGQAHERGVKIIGATAHYVTEQLDAGPIIEQDVVRVDHKYDVSDLRELGREVERTVLARAVQWHLEDRVIIDGQRTVVFR